jgi:hypothetical protein
MTNKLCHICKSRERAKLPSGKYYSYCRECKIVYDRNQKRAASARAQGAGLKPVRSVGRPRKNEAELVGERMIIEDAASGMAYRVLVLEQAPRTPGHEDARRLTISLLERGGYRVANVVPVKKPEIVVE